MNLRNLSRSIADDPRLLDDLIDGYVAWREESASVVTAYRSWSTARREERGIAYAAYVAALDREERAAGAYEHIVEAVKASPGLGVRVARLGYDPA